MPSANSSPYPHPNRLQTQQEKLVRIQEEEVYPLFGQKLADLLIQGLSLVPQAHVLQIGCGLGSTTTQLIHQSDPDSRVIAIESSQPLIERARVNVAAEHLGRRVFFRAHDLNTKLPFADNTFDCVLVNVVLADLDSPAALIAELVRVIKPGGQARLATPLAGTWREFLDVYSDVLVRLRKNETVKALAAYGKSFPESEALASQLEALGLGKVSVETTHWELVFRTGREFFYSPVIELGPLARWKSIAGKGVEVQDTFLAVKEAIDTYFTGIAFSVSVVAGVFSGLKP
jgi:ubiquinone/menaquinone biosynthesis C-methylase UbiE